MANNQIKPTLCEGPPSSWGPIWTFQPYNTCGETKPGLGKFIYPVCQVRVIAGV